MAGNVTMNKLLQAVVKMGASDLHIVVGRPPTIRLHGQLRILDTPPLEPQDMTFDPALVAGADSMGLADAFPNVGVTGSGGQTGMSVTIYRLRDGVERFLITDINNPARSIATQSAVPIAFDTITSGLTGGVGVVAFNHIPGGANVLYMDGHVEFLRYPTGVPNGESTDDYPVTPFVAMAIDRPKPGHPISPSIIGS